MCTDLKLRGRRFQRNGATALKFLHLLLGSLYSVNGECLYCCTFHHLFRTKVLYTPFTHLHTHTPRHAVQGANRAYASSTGFRFTWTGRAETEPARCGHLLFLCTAAALIAFKMLNVLHFSSELLVFCALMKVLRSSSQLPHRNCEMHLLSLQGMLRILWVLVHHRKNNRFFTLEFYLVVSSKFRVVIQRFKEID